MKALLSWPGKLCSAAWKAYCRSGLWVGKCPVCHDVYLLTRGNVGILGKYACPTCSNMGDPKYVPIHRVRWL